MPSPGAAISTSCAVACRIQSWFVRGVARLFWLTANVAADGPLCLLIDDLQWCDRASLRFIAYLEGRLEGLRVLVVTAARVDDCFRPHPQQTTYSGKVPIPPAGYASVRER